MAAIETEVVDQPKVNISMNASFTKNVFLHWPIRHSILLVGDHGVGKDGIIKSVAQMQGIPCLDIRLSQNDVGDIKGMPLRVKGRTVFAPPDWMPLKEEAEMELEELLDGIATAACKRSSAQRGILFFNEVNRGTREVQQAAFEIVLDRTTSTRPLRDGWRIASAVNGDDHYQVNTMDVAFKSRYFDINFKPSVDEWLAWAKDPAIQEKPIDPRVFDIICKDFTGMPLHPSVIGYIHQHPKMLDPTEAQLQKSETEVTLQVTNRRGWHMLSDCIRVHEELAAIGEVIAPLSPSEAAMNHLFLMTLGYVGPIAAPDFVRYVQTDYLTLSGDIILNTWSDTVEGRVRDIVKAGRTTELARYSEDIVVVMSKVKALNHFQESNLTKYFEVLTNPMRAHFYKYGLDKARIAVNHWYANKAVEDMVLEALVAPTTK